MDVPTLSEVLARMIGFIISQQQTNFEMQLLSFIITLLQKTNRPV